jgi:gas vesicle protein
MAKAYLFVDTEEELPSDAYKSIKAIEVETISENEIKKIEGIVKNVLEEAKIGDKIDSTSGELMLRVNDLRDDFSIFESNVTKRFEEINEKIFGIESRIEKTAESVENVLKMLTESVYQIGKVGKIIENASSSISNTTESLEKYFEIELKEVMNSINEMKNEIKESKKEKENILNKLAIMESEINGMIAILERLLNKYTL